jgi:hypothetical protein
MVAGSASETETLLLEVLESYRRGDKLPGSDRITAALLAAEKTTKRLNRCYNPADLLGEWRLVFVTGTQKARQRAGVVLGKGRVTPRWVRLAIVYAATDEAGAGMVGGERVGQLGQLGQSLAMIRNCVSWGPVVLELSGPTRFYAGRNIVAFDFPRIRLALGGRTLFDGFIPKGREREAKFGEQTLKTQAFFNYFWVTEGLIAARGRGGGLAIWVKE